MALTQISYTNKETLNDQPSIAAKNKVTAGDMNEIKTVVNGACTQVDTNTGDISTINNDISTMSGNITSILSKTNRIAVYREYWSASITFEMPIGSQAIMLVYEGDFIQLWNVDNELNKHVISGGSSVSFSRDNNKTTITATLGGQGTITVFVFI